MPIAFNSKALDQLLRSARLEDGEIKFDQQALLLLLLSVIFSKEAA